MTEIKVPARETCSVCNGKKRIPQPSVPGAQAMPGATVFCPNCKGAGYFEGELSIDELKQLLGIS